MKTPITVRFPPSPTGKMHLGNARTALFNWLFAKHTGGQFVVRIEDTDTERSTPENIAFIHEALNWLQLTPDNQPFLQSTHLPQHAEVAQQLVAQGKAYRDEHNVTRFKVPQGSTSWNDLVQGQITIEHKQIEDFALLRSDGTPTYHLSVVCDDIFQNVTHIIRGDDHIPNTPKQILLYQAMAKPLPHFAHLPLLLGPDGDKLSKRHGATSIQNLRDAGYLPHAVFNYMLRLGWGHGDQEIFTRQEAIQAFTLEHVSQSPARFDAAKLSWLNQHYLKTLPFAEILPHLLPFLPEQQQTHSTDITKLEHMWTDLAARATTLPEVAQAAHFLLTDVTEDFTPEHTQILLEGHHPLHDIYNAFSRLPEWTEPTIHTALDALVKANPGGFKAVGRPLRVATTAQTGGPALPKILATLGHNETLRRLKKSLHHIHANGGHH